MYLSALSKNVMLLTKEAPQTKKSKWINFTITAVQKGL